MSQGVAMVSKAHILYAQRLIQDPEILTAECFRNTKVKSAPKIGAFSSGLDGQRDYEHIPQLGVLYRQTSGHSANTLHHRIKIHSWNTLLPHCVNQFARKLIFPSISMQDF